MQDCPVFTMTENSADCELDSPLPAAIANENVKGPMEGLANNLPIWSGPGPAPPPMSVVSGAVDASSSPLAALPMAASSTGSDSAQNVVPTAPLPSIPAPLETHPAEPAIDSNYVTISNAFAGDPRITTTPPPSAETDRILVAPGEKISTTRYVHNGNEEIAQVYVTKDENNEVDVAADKDVNVAHAEAEHLRRHRYARHNLSLRFLR